MIDDPNTYMHTEIGRILGVALHHPQK